MTYTNFKRGSEWRKWDLHVHTPHSYHNSFPQWKDYVTKFKEKAVEHDIEVVGVTDYFCTTGYEELLLLCEEDTKTTSPRMKLSNGKYLYLIPIIELRLDHFTSDNTSVNLHIAFSPQILPLTIKNSFLETLDIKYQDKTLKCKDSDLVKIGHAMENSGSYNVNLDTDSIASLDKVRLVNKALSVITFSSSSFEEQVYNFDKLLQKAGIKKESYLIIIANKGHGGLADFKWQDLNRNDSRSGNIRQNLLNLTDICFSNNKDDKDFLLGEKATTPKKEVLTRFRSLKPCIWGSDAHDIANLFHPSNGATNDYTWIKADPTFEGLKQTLYEPGERVRIQPLKPDIKNERHIISELKFTDTGNLFGNQSILLNDNLNAIIGGKSSGKSLLLYSTARSIDPKQVDNTSKRLKFDGYTFEESFNFEVIWKNGSKDVYNDGEDGNKNNKITYIPQLYINHLVEKNNKEELNSLIRNILIQDFSFKDYYDTTLKSIADISKKTETHLSNYLQLRTRLTNLNTKSKEIGKSIAIQKSIEDLDLAIIEGQKLSNLSSEEFALYKQVLDKKNNKKKEQNLITKKEEVLKRIFEEVNNSSLTLLGKAGPNQEIIIKGEINRIIEEMQEVPVDVTEIVTELKKGFNSILSKLTEQITKLDIIQRKTQIVQELVLIENELAPYLIKIEGQEALKKLTQELEKEKKRKEDALHVEREYSLALDDYNEIRKMSAELLTERFNKYKEIVEKLNNEKNNIGSGITLKAELIFKREIFPLFNQVNKASLSSDHYFNTTLFDDRSVKYELIPELYSKLFRVEDDKLKIGELILPLRQKISLEEILRGFIEDHFEIDYSVTYKGDDLLNMSPGKKGTVLLILFLQISSAEYPILIDQPEDNLDNRTIYDLLCNMIKEKKKERQIIIVSHNANLVVATDTENIIVANQEGQGLPIEAGRFRFEYINGSIEHTFSKIAGVQSVLRQQGIKEHVCDILEGGDEAFKQRELKYAIK